MLFPLILANLKMILRNRQALFWALAFPLIFLAVFGLFRLDEPPTVEILVIDRARDQVSQTLIESLRAIEYFKVQEREDEAEARKELENGDVSYLLIIPEGLADQLTRRPIPEPVAITLLYDRGDQTASSIIGAVQRFIEEMNRQMLQTPTLLELRPEAVQSRQLTYFDFLLPGFVGMGVMPTPSSAWLPPWHCIGNRRY